MSADFTTRAHIGENIRAAKGVNRLLGIANQQQRVLRLPYVETAENAVLLRIGVLEFIDQRHRIACADRFGEHLAARLMQRLVETAEQIVKAQQRAQPFLTARRQANLFQRAGDHQIAQRQRFGQESVDGVEQRMTRRFALFGFLQQHALTKARQVLRHRIALRFFRYPDRNTVQPVR